MTIAEKLTIAKADLDAVYEAGKKAGGGGSGIDTSDATATAADIDCDKTAYVDGEKIIGAKQRREYSGTIDADVVGQTAYVTLLQDALLAAKREEATLFVRVECNIGPTAYTIVKNWATNVNGGAFPVTTRQLVYRYDANSLKSFAPVDKALYDDYVSGVGVLRITENGELLWYSGSPNYRIRECTFKVIVEW